MREPINRNPVHIDEQLRSHLTRRWFFKECGIGLGAIALGSLLSDDMAVGASAGPLTPKQPHFAPKVRSVTGLSKGRKS